MSESTSQEAARRGSRHNLRQKRMLVDYMQNHPDFAAGRFPTAQGKVTCKKMWMKLTAELNSAGPTKTTDQWEKAWKDMKLRARTKFVNLKTARTKTGNITADIPPLTDIDRIVLNIIGPIATEGCSTLDSLPEDMASLIRLRRGDASFMMDRPTAAPSLYQDLGLRGTTDTEDAVEDDPSQSEYGTQTTQYAASPSLLQIRPQSPQPEIENTEREPIYPLSPIVEVLRFEEISQENATQFPVISAHSIHTRHIGDAVEILPAEGNDNVDNVNNVVEPVANRNDSPNNVRKSRSTPRCVERRISRKQDIVKSFLEIQEKQTESLETLSKAVLLQATNEVERIKIQKEELAFKKEKFDRKMALEERKLDLEIKKVDIMTCSGCRKP